MMCILQYRFHLIGRLISMYDVELSLVFDAQTFHVSKDMQNNLEAHD